MKNTNSPNILSVSNLTKYFHEKGRLIKAVDDVSFTIEQGEIFGLLGQNGAGKTTTINILTNITNKDGGEVLILGRDPILHREYVRNNYNVSTAYSSLSSNLTVYQNLIIYASLYNVKNPKKRVHALLERHELEKLKDRKVGTLSSGEKTQINLCKSLLNEPKLLFLDECTVGLDPHVAHKTRKLIKEYQKETNASILFTSHYMPEVEELCDRVSFMSQGKIFKTDTPQNLKKLITHQIVHARVENGLEKLLTILDEENLQVIYKKENDIHFSIEQDSSSRLLKKIFLEGISLKSFDFKKVTLDDVFIKLTGS